MAIRNSITKQIEFDAAHSLGNGYVGKCSNLHGHRYKLDITVSLRAGKDLTPVGFIVDFSDIKNLWEEHFDSLYDHRFLNESLNIQTTAENISAKLFEDLSKYINNERVYVSGIRLYETPTSFSEISCSEPDAIADR